MIESFDVVIASPLPGKLRIGLRFAGERLIAIDFLPADTPLRRSATPRIKAIVDQLKCYFRDGKTRFSLPLDLGGTAYQQRVWLALMEIPPGKRKSYGELAKELSSGPRAVANACRANPVPIIIPCHRVVAGNGLGGYMGAVGGEPLEIKEWLLRHEGAL